MKKLILFISLLWSAESLSQETARESNPIDFDLLHTELKLTPKWDNQTLEGEAVLTLKPFFYDQNILKLNAVGFEIKEVKLNNVLSKYTYDNQILSLDFGRNYTSSDTLKIAIKYLAQPNKVVSSGSEAILSDKGLFFINPTEIANGIPRQLWTQGETQSNSHWFPTIDSPNQNHTQDIFLTVENKFTTLSNGLLLNKKDNNNGTHTDHWQQKIPHAVYLTMIAAGEFEKVVDSTFADFEVSYYVEPAYKNYAYEIFGRTPKMIRFYETLLGVKYPWQKYAQIPVRKYVSGAMENTTATVHGRNVLKNHRQLIDNNDDGVIAHELFHHWFGDYVTCESWSQLPLNESFANYSEFLWATFHLGKEEGDYVYMNALQDYLYEATQKQVPLIRFDYVSQEDMFDAHSYQKGGRVLHQLRMEVGDKAFFKALNVYLKTNALQTAEVENLRLAFEKVTGRDLKWFFDQWFKTPGHPRLGVKQEVKKNKLVLTVNQIIDSTNAQVYHLKVPLEIYSGDKKISKTLELSTANKKFEFDFEGAFKAAVLNSEGYFLGTIDHPKSDEEFITQYQVSKDFYAKIVALESLVITENENDEIGIRPIQKKNIREVYLQALKDDFWRIRQLAVQKFNNYDGEDFLEVERALQHIMQYDTKTAVKAEAILSTKNFLNPQNDILFRAALKDSSYVLNAAALEALVSNNVDDKDILIDAFKDIDDATIFGIVGNYYSENPEPMHYTWFMNKLTKMEGFEIYQNLAIFGAYLVKSDKQLQEQAVPFLRNVATQESEWYVRVAGAQVLAMLADDIPAAKKALKEAIETEKDERLLNYYQQLK
jgi:aminopeptidase N